jgi:two-component system, chemotaxis family, sensor histidine kinase and response regulator WspE
MKEGDLGELSHLSMLEIFQREAESQASIITEGLLELERNPDATHQLESLMRAAHSLKGAARIVNQASAVSLAHALEDCFVAAQHGKIQLRQEEIDLLFQGVDLLLELSKPQDETTSAQKTQLAAHVQDFLARLAAITGDKGISSEASGEPSLRTKVSENETAGALATRSAESERVLRLNAQQLNRLLGLAGESLVESRRLQPFTDSMLRLKRLQSDLLNSIENLRESFPPGQLPRRVEDQLNETIVHAAECGRLLSERMVDLEMHDHRSANVAQRLYREALQCRMRPFGEGLRRFPRMVRDLARDLGKQVRLEIVGEETQVDRDILDKLEIPLGHLMRNAVDHGCETPEARVRAGKPPEGVIRLEARHSAGTLLVTVSDDGAGVHPEELRETILQKQLMQQNAAEKLGEAELLHFLLRPGFTLKSTVTEISGRGVGLDVVQTMVRSVRGKIRIVNQPGKGMRFQLQLPLTLSVVRALLVEIAGEPYAIPLSQISRAMKLPIQQIETLEGRPHFAMAGRQIGLLMARQILERGELVTEENEIPVVVLGSRANHHYGLVVDRFLGERELVVQALDPRLGKVRNVSAGALMEDGSPLLILDVEDLLRSIEELVAEGRIATFAARQNQPQP